MSHVIGSSPFAEMPAGFSARGTIVVVVTGTSGNAGGGAVVVVVVVLGSVVVDAGATSVSSVVSGVVVGAASGLVRASSRRHIDPLLTEPACVAHTSAW